MFGPNEQNMDRLMKGFTLFFFWIYIPLMFLGWVVERFEKKSKHEIR